MVITVQFHKTMPDKTIQFCGKTYDYITNSNVNVGDIVRMWKDNKPICHATRVKIVKIRAFSNQNLEKVDCDKEV